MSPSRRRYARESPTCATWISSPLATTAVTVVPMPSATAYRGCEAMYASSLRCRARPMSDAAPILTFMWSSPPELQRRIPHLHLVSGLELGGSRDALAVEVRPVGRAEVLDVPGPVLRDQP